MLRHIVFLGGATLLVACGQHDGSAREPTVSATVTTPAPAPAASQAPSATVALQPTAGSRTYGSLQIAAMSGAVRVSGTVQGLQPESEFGFHIHEKGDCSAPDASSAGEHFNPAGSSHGHPDTDPRHAGDMQNLKSNAEGVADVDVTVNGVSLAEGATNVVGKAVVVHAQKDDYSSQPAGNSGERVACGVISIGAQPEVPASPVSGGSF
jgi:Cu-Zn family superoxide dismutase